jgi:membrane-associated phospholipid phosphatase
MDQLLTWGLGVVRGVQEFASPAMTAVMAALSFTGTEYCLMAVLPLIYWCVDKRRGLRIGILVFLSTAVNLRLKVVFAQPRPYDLDPAVALARESTFGLPSNHAQTATVLWGSFARIIRAPWGLVLAIAMPLLVGVSRVYLGVHFPSDVLAGWALGAVFLVLDRLFGDWIERAVAGLRESLVLAMVAAVSLGMNVLYPADVSMSGAFFGLAGAAVLAAKRLPFSVSGTPARRALRYLVGIATVAAVYILPKLLLAGAEAGGPPILRFSRYALLGAWVAAGAPWVFLKLRLAEKEDYSANENEGSVISK